MSLAVYKAQLAKLDEMPDSADKKSLHKFISSKINELEDEIKDNEKKAKNSKNAKAAAFRREMNTALRGATNAHKASEKAAAANAAAKYDKRIRNLMGGKRRTQKRRASKGKASRRR
jgi:hypothetical protein